MPKLLKKVAPIYCSEHCNQELFYIYDINDEYLIIVCPDCGRVVRTIGDKDA